MKFLRYGETGQEKPGLLGADGNIRDLSAPVSDLSGAVLSPETLAKLGSLDVNALLKVEKATHASAQLCVSRCRSKLLR